MLARDPRPCRAASAGRAIFALALAVAVLAPAAGSGATPARTPSQVAAISDVVVLASVRSLSSRQLPPEAPGSRGLIVTDVELSVERSLKGDGRARLVVSVPGGEVDGMRLVVSEAPAFAVGERCVVFADDAGRVVGGREGKITSRGDRVPPARSTLEEVVAAITAEQPLVSGASGDAHLWAAAPAMAAITPARQSAGTGSSVTITGSGFGSARGTVSFPLHGSYRVSAPIVSWTDTRIVCTVPAGASSGTVIVTSASGSAGAAYVVGFAYSGYKWPVSSMSYRVFPNCAELTPGSTIGGVQAGANAWNGASAFSFSYAGTAATITGASGNDQNEVYWLPGSSGRFAAGVLAQSETWVAYGTTIVESDLVFNDSYRWVIGSDTSGFDVGSVAAHEFGHALSLDDQYGAADQVKIMFGAAGPGQVNTTLSLDDIAGATYLYGAPSPPPPTAPTPVHRFYNTRTATHFYTASEEERSRVSSVLAGTYRYEGVAYSAFSTPSTGTVTLHRFHNRLSGTHFYTASEVERDHVAATLWHVYTYEGVAYHVYPAGSGTATAYRFYNRPAGTHFYTASEVERDRVNATLGGQYRYEGPAFDVPR